MSVLNIRTTKVWPENAVYIGRAGKGFDGYFGNPFKGPDRLKNIIEFKHWAAARIKTDVVYMRRVRALYGLDLMCFCAPLPCHGEILEDLAKELTLRKAGP